MRTNLLERVLDIGWAVAYVVGNGLIAAVIVFGFAYAQEIAFWKLDVLAGPRPLCRRRHGRIRLLRHGLGKHQRVLAES